MGLLRLGRDAHALWHIGRTQFQAGQDAHHHLNRTLHKQGNLVTPAHAHAAEFHCQTVGLALQFQVADAAPQVRDGHDIGLLAHLFFKGLVQQRVARRQTWALAPGFEFQAVCRLEQCHGLGTENIGGRRAVRGGQVA